jgi:hypothetical protein
VSRLDDVALAHARRCAQLAGFSDDLAAEADELGQLEDAPTAAEYRAQAAALRLKSVSAKALYHRRLRRRPQTRTRLRGRTARRRSRRVTSGPRKARAPGPLDDGEPSEPPLDVFDGLVLALGWERCA